MLCTHKPGTIIEVLLFATARQMIVEHLNVYETLVGIGAIAALLPSENSFSAALMRRTT